MAFAYQGGQCFEVFSPQGSKPLPFKVTSSKGVRREYDKTLRGTVVTIDGVTTQSKVQLPRDDKASLQLTHPYLVLQLYALSGQPLYLEFIVSDVECTGKWRLIFSSSIKETTHASHHTKLPLNGIVWNKWLNLCFHMPQLTHDNFKQLMIRTTDTIILGPCRIRKIFTLRDVQQGIPVCMDFPPGTDSQSLIFCTNPSEPSTTSSSSSFQMSPQIYPRISLPPQPSPSPPLFSYRATPPPPLSAISKLSPTTLGRPPRQPRNHSCDTSVDSSMNSGRASANAGGAAGNTSLRSSSLNHPHSGSSRASSQNRYVSPSPTHGNPSAGAAGGSSSGRNSVTYGHHHLPPRHPPQQHQVAAPHLHPASASSASSSTSSASTSSSYLSDASSGHSAHNSDGTPRSGGRHNGRRGSRGRLRYSSPLKHSNTHAAPSSEADEESLEHFGDDEDFIIEDHHDAVVDGDNRPSNSAVVTTTKPRKLSTLRIIDEGSRETTPFPEPNSSNCASMMVGDEEEEEEEEEEDGYCPTDRSQWSREHKKVTFSASTKKEDGDSWSRLLENSSQMDGEYEKLDVLSPESTGSPCAVIGVGVVCGNPNGSQKEILQQLSPVDEMSTKEDQHHHLSSSKASPPPPSTSPFSTTLHPSHAASAVAAQAAAIAVAEAAQKLCIGAAATVTPVITTSTTSTPGGPTAPSPSRRRSKKQQQQHPQPAEQPPSPPPQPETQPPLLAPPLDPISNDEKDTSVVRTVEETPTKRHHRKSKQPSVAPTPTPLSEDGPHSEQEQVTQNTSKREPMPQPSHSVSDEIDISKNDTKPRALRPPTLQPCHLTVQHTAPLLPFTSWATPRHANDLLANPTSGSSSHPFPLPLAPVTPIETSSANGKSKKKTPSPKDPSPAASNRNPSPVRDSGAYPPPVFSLLSPPTVLSSLNGSSLVSGSTSNITPANNMGASSSVSGSTRYANVTFNGSLTQRPLDPHQLSLDGHTRRGVLSSLATSARVFGTASPPPVASALSVTPHLVMLSAAMRSKSHPTNTNSSPPPDVLSAFHPPGRHRLQIDPDVLPLSSAAYAVSSQNQRLPFGNSQNTGFASSYQATGGSLSALRSLPSLARTAFPPVFANYQPSQPLSVGPLNP